MTNHITETPHHTMTYQGARARPIDSEEKRFFSVSKIHLNAAGLATHVLWSEVNRKSNNDVGTPVVVPVADVIDAIHDGAHVAAILLPPHTHSPEHAFEVITLWNGEETIDLAERLGAAAAVQLKDLAALDVDAPHKQAEHKKVEHKKVHGRSRKTFAVSKVLLDDDGRITEVLWGGVNTAKNDWAEPEVQAPVAAVVAALQAGDRVFALFPSIHGHLPDRQFVQADYDGGLQTIVLFGPTAQDRDIHDMDRIVPAKPHQPGVRLGSRVIQTAK